MTRKHESNGKADKEKEHAKGEKVRLAMLTLKDSLPETAKQAGPFGETRLDLRETMKRLEKAAKDKTVSGSFSISKIPRSVAAS